MEEQKTETNKDKNNTNEKEIISMRQLLECGVHFGHQTKRWNPKMKPYIFTARNGIHVIDLQQTLELINKTYYVVKDQVKKRGSILFVGTKKQAQEAIQEEAEKCKMPFINHRWLGGTLTNFVTIRQSINKLKKFEAIRDDQSLNKLSNKEISKKTKAYNRLLYNLEGIKNMVQTPSMIFVVDTKKEQLAIDEAKRLNIPIIGIVDTNADPSDIDYPIPANDDAIRAIKLICSVISNAVIDGQEEQTKLADIEEKFEKEEKESTENKTAPKETSKK